MNDDGHRQLLGQWFTPPAVADLALALALDQPRPSQGRFRLLDPCCGDGAFLTRARRRGLPPASLFGIEVDRRAAQLCRQHLPGAAIRCADLFAVAPETSGFDAVVGNPPYVRQERISSRHKQVIRDRLGRDWPDAPGRDLDRLVGRGDLAASCILRALRLARPGGRVALVVSSALLDADYAEPLWRLVARCGDVLAVIEAPGERWFADAAVNAMIVAMARRRHGEQADTQVAIARLRVSTAEAARRVRCLADLTAVAQLRPAPRDRPAQWAARLRAPELWFGLEQRAGEALVPLRQIAAVRRGITSGANGLFYLSRSRARALGIEARLLMPLVRSPREKATIPIDPETTSHLALIIGPERGGALPRYPAARRYVRANEHLAARPTLRARSPWWALPARPARLFLTKAYAARFVQRFAPVPVVADQRVYGLYPKEGIAVDLLAAVLNSTWSAFALESLGRASLGEGALEWTVADALDLPIVDPRRLGARPARAARRAFAVLCGRSIGEVAAEERRPDRLALDRAVGGAVGIADLLPDVHAALIASVSQRCTRARSGR